jgi:hypothetical protein
MSTAMSTAMSTLLRTGMRYSDGYSTVMSTPTYSDEYSDEEVVKRETLKCKALNKKWRLDSESEQMKGLPEGADQ